ncbi:MAG: hypothetical protein ACTHWH_18060 [Marinobacter sp.]
MDYFSQSIKQAIRTVPDWPKPGVAFRDITTVLQNKTAFRKLIDAFVHRYHGHKIDAVAAVDAWGVIVGSAMIDLPDLGGSTKLQEEGLKVYTVCSFEGE